MRKKKNKENYEIVYFFYLLEKILTERVNNF